MPARLGKLAFLALAALAVYISVGAVLCSATLHVPRATARPRDDAATVSLSARDGALLKAWWFVAPPPSQNCVLVLHGIGDSRTGGAGFASMFLSAGYSVLVPDLRAHGESGGEFITYGKLEKLDALAWHEWLRRRGCLKIYGLGESLGAAILIQAAGEQPAFAAIVAECPFSSLREVGEYRLANLSGSVFAAKLLFASANLWARTVDDLDLSGVSPLESIARSSTPILLVHGLADTRTPPSHSQKLAAANPGNSLWLVPGAGHVGAAATAPLEFRKRVFEWFAGH